jgi:hypothetical protein
VLGTIGQWIVKATGKGTTTTPAATPSTPSAQ